MSEAEAGRGQWGKKIACGTFQDCESHFHIFFIELVMIESYSQNKMNILWAS